MAEWFSSTFLVRASTLAGSFICAYAIRQTRTPSSSGICREMNLRPKRL